MVTERLEQHASQLTGMFVNFDGQEVLMQENPLAGKNSRALQTVSRASCIMHRQTPTMQLFSGNVVSEQETKALQKRACDLFASRRDLKATTAHDDIR